MWNWVIKTLWGEDQSKIPTPSTGLAQLFLHLVPAELQQEIPDSKNKECWWRKVKWWEGKSGGKEDRSDPREMKSDWEPTKSEGHLSLQFDPALTEGAGEGRDGETDKCTGEESDGGC